MTQLETDETTNLRAPIPWYRKENWWMRKPPAMAAKQGIIGRYEREDIQVVQEKPVSMTTGKGPGANTHRPATRKRMKELGAE